MKNNKLKIAVFHNLPSGGAKRAVYGFVKELSKQHYIDEYTLDTSSKTFLPLKPYVKHSYVYKVKKLPSGKMHPYVLDCCFRLVKKWYMLRSLSIVSKKIAYDINKNGYDVVYVDLCVFTHAPCILRYIKIPKVYFCQNPDRSLYESDGNTGIDKKGYLYDTICNFFLKLEVFYSIFMDKKNVLAADLILANSCYSREYIHKVYGTFACLNYLGIDAELFHPNSFTRKDFILSVGRICDIKGHHFILKALSLISIDMRPKLIIAGEFSNKGYRMQLESFAREKNIKLEIMELISDEKLVMLYNEAKIVVYVPIMEPFGLVPLEAMACGTPVIGIREGGVRESIVHGKTGLLVNRDEQELADAIRELLLNNKLREDLGKNSPEYIRSEWTWEKATEALVKNFKRCIEQHKNKT